MNIKDELRKMKADIGLIEKVACSDAENEQLKTVAKSGQLPEGIYQYKMSSTGQYVDKYYRQSEPELNSEDLAEFLQYKQLAILEEQSKKIESIKNMVTFFVVLTVLSVLGSLISVFSLVSMFR